MDQENQTILFLCTGNACRSQIAEGWARHLGGNKINVLSAGIEAHGKNPRAITVMKEIGIDISDQESTRVTPEMIKQTDILVTVCGHAEEHCPAVHANIKKIHWPVQDPAVATGSEEEIMEAFRVTRDDIYKRVENLLKHIFD